VTANNVTINGFTVQQPGGSAISDSPGISGTSILDNIITNSNTGVVLSGDSGATVAYNLVENSQLQGISVSSATNDVFQNDQVLHSGTNGFDVTGGSGLTINSNTLNGSKGMGLSLYQTSGDTLTGNLAINNTLGISVVQSNNNTFNVDYSEYNATDGIDVGDDTGNVFNGGSVNHNGLPGQGQGFLLSTVTKTTVENVTVTNNKTDGIEVAINSTSVTLTGNTVQGNGGDGIALGNTSGSTVTGNTVGGTLAGQGKAYGIDLLGSTNNTISQNTADDNTYVGIRLDPTSTGNTVKLNTMLGNGLFDAEDTSTGSGTAGTANTWTGNHEVKDNYNGGLGH